MTIVKNGFELVVIAAAGVEFAVEDEPGGGLLLALWHCSGFARVDGETFLKGDGHHFDLKAGALAGEILVAREEEVVGVAGVAGSGPFSQTCKTAVETEGGEIGQSRGGGCALRKMVPTIESLLGCSEAGLGAAGCCNTGEGEGNRLAVTEGHENAFDTGATEGRKEMGEVHLQDDLLSGVKLCEVDDAMTLTESGGGFVGWDAVEQAPQKELLGLFEKGFG